MDATSHGSTSRGLDMKTLRSIVTNLKPLHTTLFWPTSTHYRVGSGILCLMERREHHSCARAFLGNYDVFYCECGICLDNDNTHYYSRGVDRYTYICISCAAENHPV